VVISHFHGDHVNGLLTADGTPAFPNAEILVPATEWKFWMDDGEMSRAPAGRMQGLFKNNRSIFETGLKKKVTPYQCGKEVAPGLLAVETVGHTPGHTSYVLSSGSGKVFIQSDVTNNPNPFATIPVGTPSSTRTATPPRRPAAGSTTWWWPRSCRCRVSTTRSRGSAMSRRTATATGWSRRRGIRRSDASRNGGHTLTPRGRCLIAAPMINAATILIARRRRIIAVRAVVCV